MIDYNKVHDKEYLNNQIDGIGKTNDSYVLANELKMLSQKIFDGKIDASNAKVILEALKNRQAELTGKRRDYNNTDGGKKMVMTPNAVSNRNGTASIIFLVASVAATTVMYTLLVLAHFAK